MDNPYCAPSMKIGEPRWQRQIGMSGKSLASRVTAQVKRPAICYESAMIEMRRLKFDGLEWDIRGSPWPAAGHCTGLQR